MISLATVGADLREKRDFFFFLKGEDPKIYPEATKTGGRGSYNQGNKGLSLTLFVLQPDHVLYEPRSHKWNKDGVQRD